VVGVDQDDVGVEALGQVALAAPQAVALGGVRGDQLGDPAQRQALVAALGDQAGEQVLSPA
jgi:hypothetical protein